MKKIIMETTDLCKTYANEGVQNHVLKNISLEIYENDFTVLMGASGSGKTTLLNVLSKLDSVTSGKVYYNDIDLTTSNEKFLVNFRRNDFGFVFQQPNLLSDLSVYENVYIPAKLAKNKTNGEIKNDVEILLKKVGVNHIANHTRTQISGGEAQRVAIARALINKPKLLFADEPTGALNSQNGEAVLDLFSSINDENQTLLVVTHDLKTALRANRILYLADGKIVGDLALEKYNAYESKERETQILAWLRSLGW